MGDLAKEAKEFQYLPRPSPHPELLRALQQDEDAERERQQSLLERIDELCNHIQAVDDAFSQATLGLNGSQGLVSNQQFEVLVQRVDEQSSKVDECENSIKILATKLPK